MRRPGSISLAILFLYTAFCFNVAAQVDVAAEQLIPSDGLKADLKILRSAYEQLHPGLYRYNTKEKMDAAFDLLEQDFGRDLTLQQAYLAFSLFVNKIRCGHTYANFFNQTKTTADALFKGKTRLPFHFRWIGKQMVVTRNFSSAPLLARGTEIEKINGIPAGEILDTLMSIARADGGNDAKRIAYLEVAGVDRWEAFDIYFPMFFPQREPKFTLDIKPPNGSKRSVTVDAITYEERLAQRNAKADPDGEKPVFEYRHLDAKTAYLRMPNWALYDSKWDWKKFLNETIDDLIAKQTPNLIVDIRENEGGMDVGDVLASRLISSEIRRTEIKRLVRYRQIPAELKPYLDTWDRSFDNWGKDATDLKDGFYRLTRYDDESGANLIKPAGKRYTGKTFVLIGAVNSSATFQFAQLVKTNKLATLVGQPTGGSQRGINGGAFYFLKLPNSRIELDLPLIGQFPTSPMPDAGITPDIYVRQTAKDIADGRDAEIETVRKVIARSK